MQRRSAEQQLQEQKRTVYAVSGWCNVSNKVMSAVQKGFPLDATLDQLEEFFDRFGAVCTCIQDLAMCFSTKKIFDSNLCIEILHYRVFIVHTS